MSVGANIRRLRLARGLTQEALAAAAGISGPMLTQIERETKNPSLQVARALACRLGCRTDDFFDEPPTVPAEAVAE